MEENNSKIKKILFNEISLIAAVIGVFLSCFLYLTNPPRQNDTAIQLLQQQVNSQGITISELTKTQQNDLHTIELKIDEIKKQQLEIVKSITRLETMMSGIYGKFYPDSSLKEN